MNDNLCIGPIPTHLKSISGYAEHQAWMREEGYLHHEPGAVLPVRASFVRARFDGARFDGAIFDKETIEKFIKDFSVPSIPDLDSQLINILRALGNKLEMQSVHVCETTHCRSGWYCHFTAEGKRLESQLGWWLAGLLLYRAAHPDRDDVPNFLGIISLTPQREKGHKCE